MSLDVSTPNDVPLGDTVPAEVPGQRPRRRQRVDGRVVRAGAVVVAAAPAIDVAKASAAFASYPACLVSTNASASSPTRRATSPSRVADELGIEIVPLTIRIDGDEYVDRARPHRRRVLGEVRGRRRRCPRPPRRRRASSRQAYRQLAADGATGIVTVIAERRAVGHDAVGRARRARRSPTSSRSRVVDSRSVTLGLGADRRRRAPAWPPTGARPRRGRRARSRPRRRAPRCGARSTRSRT